jgi:hypothetical protein
MRSSNRRKFLRTAVSTVALQRVASAQTRAPQSPERSILNEKFIRQAIELAASARKNENHPFGALLVDENVRSYRIFTKV